MSVWFVGRGLNALPHPQKSLICHFAETLLHLTIVLCAKLLYFCFSSCQGCLQRGCDKCWRMWIEDMFTCSVQRFYMITSFQRTKEERKCNSFTLVWIWSKLFCCFHVLVMSQCPCGVNLLKFSAHGFVDSLIFTETIFVSFFSWTEKLSEWISIWWDDILDFLGSYRKGDFVPDKLDKLYYLYKSPPACKLSF